MCKGFIAALSISASTDDVSQGCVLFLGHNHLLAGEAVCRCADLHLCGGYSNRLKPLPESKHILSTGEEV